MGVLKRKGRRTRLNMSDNLPSPYGRYTVECRTRVEMRMIAGDSGKRIGI
jgi:hypothetical protein